MKILAKFLGRVHEFNEPPKPSYVTLKNVDTQIEFEAEAVSEKLKVAGIDHTDCEFEILIQEGENGKPKGMILNKLEPRKVSEEELKVISAEVDSKLTTDTPQCFEI